MNVQECIENSRAFALLKKQLQFLDIPRVVICDFDGTLFTPTMRLVYEVIGRNREVRHVLEKKAIPLIVNTSRREWGKREERDARFLGIVPDILITGCGTAIYYKGVNGEWIHDEMWERKIHGQEEFDEVLINMSVEKWIEENGIALQKVKGAPFHIRYRVRSEETERLPVIASSLQKITPQGVKVVYVESLFSNRLGFPTGYIIFTPSGAGKDAAVDYALQMYAEGLKTQVEGYCFGDGAVDLTSFLTMPSGSQYVLKQFLVHPTRLAQHLLRTGSFVHTPTFLAQNGPEAVVSVLRERLSVSQRGFWRRYVSEPGKFFLDKIYAQHLSANEITLLGLEHIIHAVDDLYKYKSSRPKAFSRYTLGLFADVADGIRARETFVTTEGQLADDFADRVREFYQLYVRGKNRLVNYPQEALISFEAALSCLLTGLVRRQAELNDIFFKEGPTLWRTKQLFVSLFFDTVLQKHKKSFLLDQAVLRSCENTYRERLQQSGKIPFDEMRASHLSEFQKKTLGRWLLYVQLFQEEHVFIQHVLSPDLYKAYLKWLDSLQLGYYLSDIDVDKVCSEFGLDKPSFSLEAYKHYFYE